METGFSVQQQERWRLQGLLYAWFQPCKTFHLCPKGYKTLENRYKLSCKFNEIEYFSTKYPPVRFPWWPEGTFHSRGAGNSDVKVKAGLWTETVEVRGDIGESWETRIKTGHEVENNWLFQSWILKLGLGARAAFYSRGKSCCCPAES